MIRNSKSSIDEKIEREGMGVKLDSSDAGYETEEKKQNWLKLFLNELERK